MSTRGDDRHHLVRRYISPVHRSLTPTGGGRRSYVNFGVRVPVFIDLRCCSSTGTSWGGGLLGPPGEGSDRNSTVGSDPVLKLPSRHSPGLLLSEKKWSIRCRPKDWMSLTHYYLQTTNPAKQCVVIHRLCIRTFSSKKPTRNTRTPSRHNYGHQHQVDKSNDTRKGDIHQGGNRRPLCPGGLPRTLKSIMVWDIHDK